MKLQYFKYYFEQKGHRYQQSVRPILDLFAKVKDRAFKENFNTKHGEALYLFKINHSIYLFAVIKDNELIKAIDKAKISQTDIHNKLQANEALGFASYIYVGDNFYGIASTFFGPKNGVWQAFLNNLIHTLLKSNSIMLETEPFPVATTPKEAAELVFKSTTRIQINDRHPLFKVFLEMFGYSDDAKVIDLVIKPEPKKELSQTVDSILETVQLVDGLEKFIIRGKAALDEALTDFYLVGTGHISDFLTEKEEAKICKQMLLKVEGNHSLQVALEAHKNDENYSADDLKALSSIGKSDGWPDSIF